MCLFEDGNANSQIRVYSVRDLCILSNTLLLLLDHVNCCSGVDFLLLRRFRFLWRVKVCPKADSF